MTDHEETACRLAGLHEANTITRSDGHGLLQQDMIPGIESRGRRLHVHPVLGAAHQCGSKLASREKVSPTLEAALWRQMMNAGELRAPLWVWLGHGDEAYFPGVALRV